MNVTTLLIIAVLVVLLIMLVTIASVNRAYAFKHTVDEKPVQNFQDDQK